MITKLLNKVCKFWRAKCISATTIFGEGTVAIWVWSGRPTTTQARLIFRSGDKSPPDADLKLLTTTLTSSLTLR